MKKLFALLLAILVVSSFSITAFAAPVDEATIDTTRTGSLDIYKYDLTNVEKVRHRAATTVLENW